MIGVHLVGVEEMLAALTEYKAAMWAATGRAVADGLHAIERDTKDELTRFTHTAGQPTDSAPGDPPALVSGQLRRSIRVAGPTVDGRTWTGSVGPTIVYGRIQELGGRAGHSSNLPARPYLSAAYDRIVAGGTLDGIFYRHWATA